jgi:hypothetical protein
VFSNPTVAHGLLASKLAALPEARRHR